MVNQTAWGGNQGVVLETSAGRLSAKTVAVTVPIEPLTARRPGFTADLPARYADAIHRQRSLGDTSLVARCPRDRLDP